MLIIVSIVNTHETKNQQSMTSQTKTKLIIVCNWNILKYQSHHVWSSVQQFDAELP